MSSRAATPLRGMDSSARSQGAAGSHTPVRGANPLRSQSPFRAARAAAQSPQVAAAQVPAGLQEGAAQRAEGEQEVLAFLKECGLQMYTVHLLQHGFDDMETLEAIEDADMAEAGLPSYHASRLRKSLQERAQRVAERHREETTRSVVSTFLQEHGLARYAPNLLNSGFDEMETLLEADASDLKDLGLPRGHAIKLKRHLREYQEGGHHEPAKALAERLASSGTTSTSSGTSASSGTTSTSLVGPAPAPAPPAPRLEASEKMKGDVQRSWEVIQQLGVPVVAEHLYKVFFELAPEAVHCFPRHVRMKYREWSAECEEDSDLTKSAALRNLFGKFLSAIGCMVAGLRDSTQLVPTLLSLGRRHIGYDVKEEFWPALGQALNRALSDILGAGFTLEVENAWTVVYGFTSSVMVGGLQQAKELARRLELDVVKKKSSASSTTASSLPSIEP